MAWLKYVGITMDKKVETVTMDRGVGVHFFLTTEQIGEDHLSRV